MESNLLRTRTSNWLVLAKKPAHQPIRPASRMSSGTDLMMALAIRGSRHHSTTQKQKRQVPVHGCRRRHDMPSLHFRSEGVPTQEKSRWRGLARKSVCMHHCDGPTLSSLYIVTGRGRCRDCPSSSAETSCLTGCAPRASDWLSRIFGLHLVSKQGVQTR